MDYTWIVAQAAELLAIYAEIEGMKAENLQRQHRGEAIAWDNNQFCEMAAQARSVESYIMKNR